MHLTYILKLHWFIIFTILAFFVLICWFSVTELLPRALPTVKISNTEKSGVILLNENWSGEIKITGDIWASPGTTVTLQPGTKITVNSKEDKFNLDLLPWRLWSGLNTGEESYGVKNGELFWDEGSRISIKFGRLNAMGNKSQPIVIKSDSNRPGSPYDLNEIFIKWGVISNANLSNYRRLIVGSGVVLMENNFNDTGDCAVCINYSNPTIIKNTFQNSIREYIWIAGGSPRISDNLFLNSEGRGIVVGAKNMGTPQIDHNDFQMQGKIALEFSPESEDRGGIVSNNNFAVSNMILLPCDTRVKLLHNNILGTVDFGGSNSCTETQTLGPNFWGSRDVKTILQEKITGKSPSFKILLPSLLSVPPKGAGRRP